MGDTLFFYGTLRDPEVRAAVLGDVAPARPAWLADHAVLRVAGEHYPVLVAVPGHAAEGVLVDPAPRGRARVAFFEAGERYALTGVEVATPEGPVTAQTFAATTPAPATDGAWDFAHWQATRQPAFLEGALEFMDAFDPPPPGGAPIWASLKHRAEARVRARAAPVTQHLRRGFTRVDVVTEALARPYARFFAVEEHRLRHRRFDGRWSPPILRAAFVSGDAVTVLPYDPRADSVLLVEQWRAGPWARGDRAPWQLEPVAGRHDPGETVEATARREAGEEAGLTLGRLERIAGYYPSPGILAEYITSFVGEADLSAAGGVFGLAGEDEDIRAVVVPLADALHAVTTGEAGNAPLILSLLWLAAHRDRLRAAWAARDA